MWQGCFSFIIISQLQWPVELKFSNACYFMHICWDTPSEENGLWQLPKVSSAFKCFCVIPCQITQRHLSKDINFQPVWPSGYQLMVVWLSAVRRFLTEMEEKEHAVAWKPFIRWSLNLKFELVGPRLPHLPNLSQFAISFGDLTQKDPSAKRKHSGYQSHMVHMWHGILAGSLILASI